MAMLLSILADGTNSSLWLPQSASRIAPQIDGLFNFVLFINVFFVALITVLLVVFVIKYRHRPGHTDHSMHAGHSTALELTWTIIPLIIVLIIYLIGFHGYMHMTDPPQSADQVTATGKMWSWSFTYDNGFTETGTLHLRKGVPVKLTLQSQDVIHGLFFPEFRVKKDVVPGRWNDLWFTPTEDGVYDIFCSMYCGTGHSQMRAKCYVMEPDDFDKWLATASNWMLTVSPYQEGVKLYTDNCAQCHSTVKDTTIIGPSWRDLFDSTQNFQDGSKHLVDENYVLTGVWDPSTFNVVGFKNVMPSFKGQLTQQQIGAIIDYMKTISTNYKGDTKSFYKIAGAGPTTAPATRPSAAPAAAPVSPPGAAH